MIVKHINDKDLIECDLCFECFDKDDGFYESKILDGCACQDCCENLTRYNLEKLIHISRVLQCHLREERENNANSFIKEKIKSIINNLKEHRYIDISSDFIIEKIKEIVEVPGIKISEQLAINLALNWEFGD